jgi:rhodanese-related sulfurtransferase
MSGHFTSSGAASDPDCAIIVDVRSTQEYDQEHLEGTVNIPSSKNLS